MKCRAYAKINLTLDVTGKREDGYHLLDTVMQSVSLYDELELRREEEPGIRLRCDKEYLPLDTKNTAYRAARLFFEHCGLEQAGVLVAIHKRIPSRAGMGGGSADAAAVLCGLNNLFSVGLSREELAGLGAQIGADVPFCVLGGTRRCRGIGELTEPVAPLPDCFLVLCKPPAGMSTPRAFALIDKYPLLKSGGTPKMLEALESGSLQRVAGALSNRFDATMRLMQVRQIKKRMRSAGALGTLMTGSGSAVYGVFAEQAQAQSCAQLLQGNGEVFLATPQREV